MAHDFTQLSAGVTQSDDLIVRLRSLMEAATPGPYRAHDHNDMARIGADPDDWIGYGWVGRVTPNSGPNGSFDGGWLDADRREDACKEYRERASADVHFVTEALNALPELLTRLSSTAALEAEVSMMRAEWKRDREAKEALMDDALTAGAEIASLKERLESAERILRAIVYMNGRTPAQTYWFGEGRAFLQEQEKQNG